MLAGKQFFTEKIDEYLLVGELALDGRVRAVRGALAAAMSAARAGRRGVIVPADNAAEAAVVDGLDVIAVQFLSEAVGFLTDELPIEPHVVDLDEVFAVAGKYDVDFSDPDVYRDGQESAKRALTVAAACREPPERPGITIPMDIGNRPAGLEEDRVRRPTFAPTILLLDGRPARMYAYGHG